MASVVLSGEGVEVLLGDDFVGEIGVVLVALAVGDDVVIIPNSFDGDCSKLVVDEFAVIEEDGCRDDELLESFRCLRSLLWSMCNE